MREATDSDRPTDRTSSEYEKCIHKLVLFMFSAIQGWLKINFYIKLSLSSDFTLSLLVLSYEFQLR